MVCPDGVDPDEYNDITLIYSVVKDECTTYSCPVMSAGKVSVFDEEVRNSYEFLWTDKYKYRKPTRLPAQTYIENLMSWILSLLQDDSLFPTEPST